MHYETSSLPYHAQKSEISPSGSPIKNRSDFIRIRKQKYVLQTYKLDSIVL
ncbi:hypothetical protein PORCRE_782 [Porphyromonas crevioricanis JCM 15906]|uniref:Uncharacterized protein n=1 Tax=Porphyromonas crevioricanis JCM 15906 TaxID=1305617 RepID=T1DS11_9PORP|nr:hypothetical protein PORCRE_782 [Porphyromonas crevioricanis JCM 15906]GAD07320.1 hypothetical protein PORCAN_940 [Porphyromonas crevioricanis JCM 13913]